jgi:hypothetical protein
LTPCVGFLAAQVKARLFHSLDFAELLCNPIQDLSDKPFPIFGPRCTTLLFLDDQVPIFQQGVNTLSFTDSHALERALARTALICW